MKIKNDLATNLNGTAHVFNEITGQPNLWNATFESVVSNKSQIADFLTNILKIKNLQIILTGAGSSAFIGEILQQSFYKNTGIPTKAIPTTDLVTHPEGYFQKLAPTLLISFARSGDSPESIATYELAEKLHDTIFHLIITCNPEGGLAKTAYNKKNSFIFSLPDKANDLALAMTGSFTSMVLAGLLISDIKNLKKNEKTVNGVVEFGKTILKNYISKLSEIAELDFKRVVFLGSGALKGAAKESHLKVLELTDGQIICQYDSFLGFRHGPRAVIDESTLIIYLFSRDPYVYNYEVDLVKSITSNEHFLFSIGIGQCLTELEDLELNLTIDLCSGVNKIPDDFFTICAVIPAQILGFYKSLSLGLTPDSPSKNGGINRIVQGVNIYPY
jgi:tagatose-6-phosphate ketose/aldose isomerase